jgi:hypothetical protein
MEIGVREFGGWQHNLWLWREGVQLVVTLDVGPRVVHYGRSREESPLALFGDQLGGSMEERFMIRGGHRLWIAPESDGRSDTPDNAPVCWDRLPDGVVTTAPVESSGLQKRLTVRLLDGGVAHARHEVVNTGGATTICAPWAITVVRLGGTIIVPLARDEHDADRFVPDQRWSFWPYASPADARVEQGARCLRLRAEASAGPPFKIGIEHRQGWVGYLRGGRCFIKAFIRREATYPDGGANLEIYLGNRGAEIESLGPLIALEPGDTTVHDELWSIVDVDPHGCEVWETVEPAGRTLASLLAGVVGGDAAATRLMTAAEGANATR